MNSVDLYKLKNDTKCVFLSETIISNILDSFSKSNIKIIKCVKKQVSTIKTNKVQAKKDLNENKIIMIMNKISENNINELVGEYLSNILVDTEEKYNVIMTEIFNKMIKDIKFAEIYIKFAMKIFIIEKKRLNLFPEEFIDLVKNNIKNDDDDSRSASYTIIKLLVKYSFFNENIIKSISDYVISIQDKTKFIDCYYWFNGLDISDYKDNILSIANKCNIENMNREKIMIESLIENKKEEEVELNETINEDKFSTSCFNIIEEYQFLKSIDEVIEFINTECSNINNKNIFCTELIDFYISNDSDNLNEGIELIDVLIKKKILFKSNISKGLVMYLNKYENAESKYIVQILKYLKNNNITKNIEYIFKKYKIKLFYD